MKKIFQSHKPDYLFLSCVIGLLLFGLLMVYNASPVTSLRDFGDQFYLIRLQIIWAVIALFIGLLIYRIPYLFWQKVSPFLIVLSDILLIAVFIPGLGSKVYGAQRWLNFGVVGLQPAEFAKLAYIVFLATLFSKKVKPFPFLAITILLLAIVFAQKDMGTSIVFISIGITMYFVAGAPIWHFLIGLPALAVLGFLMIFTVGYRKDRLLAFLNPMVDTQGISYHIYQVLLALGSGGWSGVGLGQSRQKYGFIPEITTDSIFAVVANELGFVGSFVFVAVFILFIYLGFRIAKKAPDTFSHLVAVGMTTWIGVQAFINLAGLSALLPLTGVPLPLISYGGSSLVSVIAGCAILLNISRYTRSTVKIGKK